MSERPIIGDAAPPLEADDTAGDRWYLHEHRGHPVVLVFHRHIH